MTNTQSQDRFAHLRMLSMQEVCDLTRYSRTHIYRLEAAGQFPRRVKLGPNRIGFRLAEFEAWMLARPRGNLCVLGDNEPEGVSP
jgi:prophage regulatory protein